MKLFPLLIALLILPFSAAAECMPFDDILQLLADGYGEAPIFTGVAPVGDVIVTAAPDGGTFTVLLLVPDGAACPVASGDGWSVKLPNAPDATGKAG